VAGAFERSFGGVVVDGDRLHLGQVLEAFAHLARLFVPSGSDTTRRRTTQ
jgi:hypothetical protein